MLHTVSYTGKILFEPENKTKKHLAQATWKKVAMVVFEGDICQYYSWFLKKRFNLELEKPLRGPHITFINDSIDDLNNRTGSIEDKEKSWDILKSKWDGKEIKIVLNLRPFSDITHWWLIVDHKFREELHSIRAEIGLSRPYFGLHLTIGRLSENKNDKGEEVFNRDLEHSKYINFLHDAGMVEINKDYTEKIPVEIKRISSERADLYNPNDELLGTVFNEYELNHVRIQIARKRLSGYYFLWKKTQRVNIESNGKIKYWPHGFFDMKEIQLAELFTIQKEIRDEENTNN